MTAKKSCFSAARECPRRAGYPISEASTGFIIRSMIIKPETIISHSFFVRYPEEFYRFYRDKMIFPDAKPNDAHKKLAELEKCGKLSAVVTQNIDGLHQMAGSKNVIELHGSVHRNYCTKCGKFYPLSAITESAGVPKCSCGGTIKPDVVLYEESLKTEDIERAVSEISAADTLIIGGTSLVVYPAAGLVRYFKGKHLAVINKSEINANNAELVINDSIGKVMSKIICERKENG